MSRGSFRYKEKISWKHQCKLDSCTETPTGYVMVFSDAKTRQQVKLTISEEEGRTILRSEADEGCINRYWLTIPTNEKEHIYGCGETYSKLDLKGEAVRIWVAEHQNAGRITKKILKEKIRGPKPKRVLPFGKYESYYAQPTFTSSDLYYMHGNLKAYSVFDFTVPQEITFYTQEPIDLVYEEGQDFTDVSRRLSALLGRQDQLPEWIYDGSILAIQEGPAVINEKLQKAKEAGTVVNGVWSQDWCGCRRTGFGYQVMWNWKADETLYPDLAKHIKAWKEAGIRFLGYINPFLAIEKPLYEEATKLGYCVKDREGQDYLVKITTFPAAMIDLTNPDAYRWYKDLIKNNMIGIGMGGWMADFGEYLPVDCVLHSGEDPALVHNEWPAIWAKLNREAIEECGKTGEIFFFTRAGHTKTIAYSTMMWTGDQHVDWSVDDGLPSVIPATLSLAMSGYGITHSDVGGYTTIMHMRRDKELLMRWEEMNIFSPLWRSHEGNQPVNDVQFDGDEELLAHLGRCSRAHTALKSYLMDCVQETANQGTPVMRPVFYHYDEEWAYTDKSEYLLGRDLLIAPVLDPGSTTRECHLPQDEWIHLTSGASYRGGTITVDAPIGQIPVFVRATSPRKDELLKLRSILGA